MKFKLIEKFDETRSIVQDYMYDAIYELNNDSLEEYIQWFKDNLTAYPEDIEQAVTDAYIEACDYGMIKGVEKTRLTSELKEYIESNVDLIDKDINELVNNCPDHLKHELTLVLDKIDNSLNERFDADKAKSTLIKGHIFKHPTTTEEKFQIFDKPNTIQKLEENYCVVYDIATKEHPLTHQTILNKLEKELSKTIDTCAFVCMYDSNSDTIIVELSDDKFNIFKKLLVEASEVFFMSF